MPAIACARTPQTPTTSLARVRSPAHAPCRTQAAMHTHTNAHTHTVPHRTQNRTEQKDQVHKFYPPNNRDHKQPRAVVSRIPGRRIITTLIPEPFKGGAVRFYAGPSCSPSINKSCGANFGILQPLRRRLLVTAATSVRCSDRLRSVADSGEARCARSIRPLLGCAGHFLPSDLRRPARSCGGALRIRRRTRTHLAESDALGGPMKDRPWRWPIPMMIDLTRRGTIDRADAAGPCRGRATG